MLAVVDPHVDLVDVYLEGAERAGSPIVAVFETHVQADHVSGLPALVARTGATAYLPAAAGVEFAHEPLELADHVVVWPGHYAGSVCGRGLSGNPVSSIGFERAHNAMLGYDDADGFAAALVADLPPRPAEQERIVAANRRGGTLASA